MFRSFPVNKSTIVRARLAMRLMLYRSGFRVLERLAPRLGGVWAVRLWATPPRSAAPADNRPHAGLRARLPTRSGATIMAETWGESGGPPVYLLHGWGGWRGQLGGFVEPLVAAGHHVVAVDAPSHGESGPGMLGGKRGTFPEFAEALNAAIDVYGGPVRIVAHSMGASVAALAVRDGLVPERMVLVAPSVDVTGSISEFERVLGFGSRVRTRLIERLEQLGGRAMRDYDLTRVPAHTTVPPTLIVHDRTDRRVEAWQGAALAGSWPGSRLLRTDRLGHHRILRDPDVVSDAVEFLTAERHPVASPPRHQELGHERDRAGGGGCSAAPIRAADSGPVPGR